MSIFSNRASQAGIKDLNKLLQSLEVKYGANKLYSSYSNGADLSTVASALNEVVVKMQDEIRSKEKELALLKPYAVARYFSADMITQPTTPNHGTPIKSIAIEPSSLITPIKRSEAGQELVPWSAIKSAIKLASPSASGAARLHAELVKEVLHTHCYSL
jgi:hypothetical protein